MGVQWTGFLTPPDSGDYLIGIRASGFANVMVDGKAVAEEFTTQGVEAKTRARAPGQRAERSR